MWKSPPILAGAAAFAVMAVVGVSAVPALAGTPVAGIAQRAHSSVNGADGALPKSAGPEVSPPPPARALLPESSGGYLSPPRVAVPLTRAPRVSAPSVSEVSKPTVVDLGIQASFLSSAQIQQVLLDAKAAGASVVSTAASWSSLRPNEDQPYIWNLEDEVVNSALALGLKVRLQAEQMPLWARDPGDPTGPWVPPRSAREVAGFAGFVSDLAKHYGSKVSYIEIWNEPNISDFWSTGPDPTQFAALLKASYLAIKAASPTTMVISGGTSRNDVGFHSQTYTALANIGGDVANHYYFDMLGVHPYAGNRSPLVDSPAWVYDSTFGLMDENFSGYQRLIALMDAHGETSKQIYITEYGLSTVEWSGYPPVSDATRATYLTEAYSLISSNPRVFGMSWFYLLTTPWDGPGFALLNTQLQPSASFEALETWSRNVGAGSAKSMRFIR